MEGFRLGQKADAAGYRLTAFDSIGSTNTEALKAASAGDPGAIWFAALEQTAGRGRRGRIWATNRGNLAASVLVVPEADPALVPTLGFVAGVALNRALSHILPNGRIRLGVDGADGTVGRSGAARIALKWPNDVLADGAKLAGILLEAQQRPQGPAIVIGFGVNVCVYPEDTPYPATSLQEMGVGLSAPDVFWALSDAWVEAYDLWDNGRGIGHVLSVWRQLAAGIGAPVAINNNGQVVRGIFETIDDSGRLIVRADDDSRIAITAGDVHFGATASVR